MLEASGLTMIMPCGRILFQQLQLSLDRERVALIGRNGVGKSTLLEVLAGWRKPTSGKVLRRSKTHLVRQLQEPTDLSHGELRKQRLAEAQRQAPALLLLDEPTQDLDAAGIAWLRHWLNRWPGGALVASHDTQLLQDFEHFFLLSENGCRYFRGSLTSLESELERQDAAREAAYLSSLQRLVDQEEKADLVARRRARKERYGRVREMDRGSPRVILNMKRNQAQVNHGKQKAEREARLEAVRQFTKASRRALQVKLPLTLPDLDWETTLDSPIVVVSELGLTLKHQRLAVIGPNGSGHSFRDHGRPSQARARLRLVGPCAPGHHCPGRRGLNAGGEFAWLYQSGRSGGPQVSPGSGSASSALP
ncbi:MAG: ATP-binding cassette domain-containing protein [Candidatus Eremiobacteraeota bacterium]|nr:ATP-binding cassette domain-containing protein [Candidatus Eremiobacteraeota bacterium]MCW5868608.1 ATP-binding cassette domain-containing protein [Candidatus Eremiobacteraeota bacterium]